MAVICGHLPKREANIVGKSDKDKDTNKKKVDSLIEDQLLDDTMYGEIIPSLMGWTSFENQEQRTKRLTEISEEITAEKKGKKKKKK